MFKVEQLTVFTLLLVNPTLPNIVLFYESDISTTSQKTSVAIFCSGNILGSKFRLLCLAKAKIAHMS